MRSFQPYVEDLQKLAGDVSAHGLGSVDSNAVAAALDGGTSDALRRLVEIKIRRANGVFFTSTDLASAAWEVLSPTLQPESIIVDPTCGAGSLLIPGALKLFRLVENPFQASKQIRGLDLEESFVDAARARLFLALAKAELLTGEGCKFSPSDLLDVRRGDFLEEASELLVDATHVVLNPPYNMVVSAHSHDWTSGLINNAALFTNLCIAKLKDNAEIVAILPDVLKSGTRYSRWRDRIENVATINNIVSWGQFDSRTDVHVFMLHATKGRQPGGVTSKISSTKPPQLSSKHEQGAEPIAHTVSDYFTVGAGAVVPHRHKEIGPERPFATARLLPVDETIASMDLRRRFSGKCETPPFVAIRRTSRPGQIPRIRATIISGPEEIAVDNHLLVARPYDGSVTSCEELVKLFSQPSTTYWLDQNFQCRHLPVRAILQLPWAVEGGLNA